ncbi:MAG: hypothetical protein NZ879_00910 [Archaeoglobaceae archaeon]|nr:hypothetical protein [Archaeoglobaceae archaeon]MDW8117526.1 hypothetical protein [Archaeoglobaceae archaeon]
MNLKLIVFLIILILVSTTDARVFRFTFEGITPDMPYPSGFIQYRLDDVFNGFGTIVRENLTLGDFLVLAYRDDNNLSVTSLDSDCDDTQSWRCNIITLSISSYGRAQCHSWATAILQLNFSVYRPSINATLPVRINSYLAWEAEGDQNGTNWNCDGTEYANFYIQVFNWSTSTWVNMTSSTGTGVRSGVGWFNITISDPGYVNATTGELRYRIFVDAYDCYGREEDQQAMCGSLARAELYVDYIELVQDVPDAVLQPVCVYNITSTFPPIWSDLWHNDTVSFVVEARNATGSLVPFFPVRLHTIDEYGVEQFVGVGITNSTGRTTFFRITGGEGYRMNFSKIEAWDGWMINNSVYVRNTTCGNQSITPPPDRGRNIALVPAKYVLNLIGRMYYPGGVDWARFVWYIDDPSVQRHRSISISQKFINHTASFSIWKFGFDYNCTDNRTPCDREGIFNLTTPPWNPACIVIGQTNRTLTPFCNRPPVGLTPLRADVSLCLLSIVNIGVTVGGVISAPNCYIDRDQYGNPVGAHRCGLFYGYRVGPLMMMAIPDNALGYTAQLAIAQYGSLSAFMSQTNYSQHEGPGNLSLSSRSLTICGFTSTQDAFSPPHTEYVFSYPIQAPIRVSTPFGTATGYATLQPDRRGGLGLIGFLGLYGDQNHIVGVILGHRFGVHPFLAIVQTVPEYPTTAAGWTGYEHRWLYYLYENLRFIAEAQGKEMSIWNWRYPNATAQANLVRAFEDLIVEFTPFLKVTLDLMVSAPRTLVYPFVVTTFLQLGDFGYLMKVSYTNTTIFDKAVEAAEALMRNLGNILGPPPPNCPVNATWNDPNAYRCYGLNFIWMGSRLLTYAERELFAYRLVELFSTLIDLQIEVFKALPELNNTTAPWAYPRWDYNWIHPE